MTRRYARAKKNQRAADSTPLNTPATTTILSSIRLDGSCIYTTYQGGTTAEQFESYLKSDLLPTLSPDNCNLRRTAATGAFASGHPAEPNGHLH